MCETLREPVKVLKSLSEQAINKQYKFKRLYRNLYNPEFYFLAYKNISQSQGSMTSGVDGKSLDGMSEKRISALIESIRSFSYQPNPARRVYIEKKNSTKKRPLGIPSTEDKLVQEVVKMILESIYEPNFSDCSHGFRPKRSCHSALQQIQNQFTGITWFVEGDIHACFDSFDHHVLVNILRERIEDENFLALIWKMLKAGYMEQWAYNCTFSGTPQGSGVSPILANIYLSKLDDFAENLKKSFNKGKSKENLEYQRAASKLYYIRRKNRANWENWNEQQRKEALRLQKDAINYMHSLPSKRANNKEYKSLVYCRYADDFLIGVIGSFEDASEIKEKFRVFLEDTLHLEMSEEKTKITHSQDKARFLGYDITTAKNSALKYDSKHQLRKTHTGRIKLYAPRDKWQGKLTEYGALRIRYDKNGKEIWDSHHRGNMVHMTDVEIVSQREELLPSEKAFAYKMKMDAMKRQAGRPSKNNSTQVGRNFETAELIGKETGESKNTIRRFIRLTELIPELLDYVDKKRLPFTVAVDISYIDKEIQTWLFEYIKENGTVKAVQVAALRTALEVGPMTQAKMISILVNSQPGRKQEQKITLSEKKLRNFFSDKYTVEDMESVILELLDQWKRGEITV